MKSLRGKILRATILKVSLFLTSSLLLYFNLDRISRWITFSLLKMDPATKIGSAVQFFIFDTPKVLILLMVIVFIVGVTRTFFTPERIKKTLSGKSEFTGNILASLLGIMIHRFCY